MVDDAYTPDTPPLQGADRCAPISGEIIVEPEVERRRRDPEMARVGGLGLVSRPPPPWSGATILDRYRLIRRIGAGDRSEVFEAQCLRTRRRVALKKLRPERELDCAAFDGLHAEISLLHWCRSSRVIETPDERFSFEYTILIMAMARGVSLARRLQLWGPVEIELAIRVGLDLCHLLLRFREAAFQVTRVKPTDVFVDRRFGVHFVGFDVRRIAQRAGEAAASTAELTAVASLVREIAFPPGIRGRGAPSSTALQRVLDIAAGDDPRERYPDLTALRRGLIRARRAAEHECTGRA